MRHPLAVLATRMPCTQIVGPSLALSGAGVSNAGWPRLPIRLMALSNLCMVRKRILQEMEA